MSMTVIIGRLTVPADAALKQSRIDAGELVRLRVAPMRLPRQYQHHFRAQNDGQLQRQLHSFLKMSTGHSDLEQQTTGQAARRAARSHTPRSSHACSKRSISSASSRQFRINSK
jgi:hypothetical protein